MAGVTIDEIGRPTAGGRREGRFLEGPTAKTYCRVNYHTCVTRSALQPGCSLVPVLAAHPARLTTCLSGHADCVDHRVEVELID